MVSEGGISSLKSKSRGASFCQVNRSDTDGQFNDAAVDGNHWNIGAIPALVMSANRRNMALRLFHGPSHVVGPSRNKTDPVACARKYLHAAAVLSVAGPIGWKAIKGINESKFISIPNQAINQLGAVRDVSVPRISEVINRIDEIGIIRENELFYCGGLSPMHYSATLI